VKDGERGRNRTFNLLIKSQLLCQLSYAPEPPNFAGEVIVDCNIRQRCPAFAWMRGTDLNVLDQHRMRSPSSSRLLDNDFLTLLAVASATSHPCDITMAKGGLSRSG
jgi:hypothetical protein